MHVKNQSNFVKEEKSGRSSYKLSKYNKIA